MHKCIMGCLAFLLNRNVEVDIVRPLSEIDLFSNARCSFSMQLVWMQNEVFSLESRFGGRIQYRGRRQCIR